MKKETEGQMLYVFERSLEAGGIRTHADYVTRVREFLSFAKEEGYTWDSVPEGLSERYVKALLERGSARRTVNNKLSGLKKWGRWCVITGRTAENPLRDTERLPVGPWVPKHILGIEDAGLFLSSFRLRTPLDILAKAVIELQYGSGVRISEAVSIREADLDRGNRTAKIFEAKTQRERRVLLTGAFLNALEFYYEEARDALLSAADMDADRVFPRKAHTTLRVRINSIMAREAKRLGLQRITSHSLRHMAATHLLKKGAGIRHVQAFLGHQTITTTQGYARVCTDDLKKVLESCHPLEAPDVEPDA